MVSSCVMSSMGPSCTRRSEGSERGAMPNDTRRSPCRVPEGTLSQTLVTREAAGQDETAPRNFEFTGPSQIRHAAAHLGARADHQLREVGLRERQIDEHARRIRLPEVVGEDLELV